MYQNKRTEGPRKWGQKVYRMCLLGVMGLVLAGLAMTAGLTPLAYASGPGGNVSDPVVRAVDIAKPAVVRIFTLLVGQVTVSINGKNVTFPLTPQKGFNGYPLEYSGSGAFISAHGDILTADHVVHPVQDDKQSVDQDLDQSAAPDIANYMNQRSTQQVSADQVFQALTTGQIPSTTKYNDSRSQVFLSTDFSGPVAATSFQSLPQSQYALVDQIVKSSPFSQFDTAIIHVNGMDNMPMLQLGDSSTVHEQDQLSIIGFPGNGDVSTDPNGILTSSVNPISVSSIKTSTSGAPLIQVAGNVEHGDSGGPAVDNTGQVVGIVSFGVGTSGGTSFLRAASSAKEMLAQANIDITSSAAQKAWSKAFIDYADTVPGHWHQSMREFQQLIKQFPQFKAVNQYLQYATQQAQQETQTQESGAPTSSPSSSGNTLPGTSINTSTLLIGGVIFLFLIVFGSSFVIVTRSRAQRRKAAQAAAQAAYRSPGLASYPAQGYGAPVPGTSLPGQLPPAPAPTLPQTPPYPGQISYGQPQSLPQTPRPAPQWPQQPAFRPQQGVGSSMASFGAPPPMKPAAPAPPREPDNDATVFSRPPSAGSQLRVWSCGHTNRTDARFCGICGEPAPRPLVRRVEQ